MQIDLTDLHLDDELHRGVALLPPGSVKLEDVFQLPPDLQYFIAVRRATGSGDDSGDDWEAGVIIRSQAEESAFAAWFMTPLRPQVILDDECDVRLSDLLDQPTELLPLLIPAAFARAIAPYAKLVISCDGLSHTPISFYLTVNECTPRLFEAADSFSEVVLEDLLSSRSLEFDPVNQ